MPASPVNIVFTVAATVQLMAMGRAQEAAVPTIPALTKFKQWAYTPPAELLPLTYHRAGMALLAERRASVGELGRSAAPWRARQAEVLGVLKAQTFAPLDLPKTPLNPVVTKRTVDPRGFEVGTFDLIT
jgi:hypothetical protein